MFKPFLFIFLSISLECVLAKESDEGENVALKKTVYVKGNWAQCLTDGNFHTTVSPYSDVLPLVAVDLEDVYELTSIRVHAQNEGTFGDAGLNIPFAVYVWSNFTSVCDLAQEHPWTLVKSNLTFTKKGEEIVIPGPIEARYIIVLVHKEDEKAQVPGLVMGELRAFGKKIKDGFRLTAFDSDPEPENEIMLLRRLLLSRQRFLHIRNGYFEYKMNPKYNDVALTWTFNRINTMAVERGKGRVITLSGKEAIRRMFIDYFDNPILDDFKKWLNPDLPKVRYRRVIDKFNASDIILINRDYKFDSEEISKKILSGENSAIISYDGLQVEKEDDTTRLLKKLEIIVQPHESQYVPTSQDLKYFAGSAEYLPPSIAYKEAVRSWKVFSGADFVKTYSEEDTNSPEFQKIVRQLLDRYKDVYKLYPICPSHPYKTHYKTDIAMFNYNRLLMLQRGSKILPAPGSSCAPGAVQPIAEPRTYNVTFKIDIAGRFFPMGGYAKPGEAFRYKVISATNPKLNGYRIRINPQTDSVDQKKQMARWPFVTMVWDLKNEGQLASPFGGPIVLQIPGNSNLTIQFENVYRYPFFDNRNPDSEKNWESEKEKYKGVPYLMVHGDNMISMLDSTIVTKMTGEEIKWATTYYDNMVKIIHNYRGSSHETSRMEVFVTDDDISIGYGHAGYPWMGYREWGNSFQDLNQIKLGHVIGYPHEVGHNLQVHQITFKHGGEVTNNMYIPVVHQYLLGLKSYEKGGVPGYRPGDVEQVVGVWKSGVYDGVKESYYTFFGRYFSPALVGNVIHTAMKTREPLDTEERKVAFFIKNLCNESKYDVVPFHRLWNFPIDSKTVEFCAQFPCWFPDDEITQRVPDLVEKAKATSKTKCSSDPPKKVEYKFDLMYGINKIKPQSIFIHD